MTATVNEERIIAERNAETGKWAVFQGRNLVRFFIAGWPKVTQQFVGLSVFNSYATYFCEFKDQVSRICTNAFVVQYAGFNNPFIVTVILACVQLISMIVTSTTTDRFGRRPLTVYPYAVTVCSLLSLGIVGCFDYKKPTLSSLLVRICLM